MNMKANPKLGEVEEAEVEEEVMVVKVMASAISI